MLAFVSVLETGSELSCTISLSLMDVAEVPFAVCILAMLEGGVLWIAAAVLAVPLTVKLVSTMGSALGDARSAEKTDANERPQAKPQQMTCETTCLFVEVS